jgi:hypothetical protein
MNWTESPLSKKASWVYHYMVQYHGAIPRDSTCTWLGLLQEQAEILPWEVWQEASLESKSGILCHMFDPDADANFKQDGLALYTYSIPAMLYGALNYDKGVPVNNLRPSTLINVKNASKIPYNDPMGLMAYYTITSLFRHHTYLKSIDSSLY